MEILSHFHASYVPHTIAALEEFDLDLSILQRAVTCTATSGTTELTAAAVAQQQHTALKMHKYQCGFSIIWKISAAIACTQ